MNEKTKIVNFRLSRKHIDTLERLADTNLCKTVDIIRSLLDSRTSALELIHQRKQELFCDLERLQRLEEIEIQRLNPQKSETSSDTNPDTNQTQNSQ